MLPVSCEILADICTPIESLKILKNISTHCYLLESAQPSEKWGRYTFLGLDPKMEITCRNGVMKAAAEAGTYQRELLDKGEKDAIRKFEAAGVQVNPIPADELAKIQERVKPVVAKFAPQIGEDFVKAFYAEIDKARAAK